MAVSDRLTQIFKENGMILVASKGIVTIAPPISITRDDIDEIVTKLDISIAIRNIVFVNPFGRAPPFRTLIQIYTYHFRSQSGRRGGEDHFLLTGQAGHY